MQVAHKGKESYQNRFNVYVLNRNKFLVPKTVHEWFQIDLCLLNMGGRTTRSHYPRSLRVIKREESKLRAPDGERPVPAGPLAQHKARPLLANKATSPGQNKNPHHTQSAEPSRGANGRRQGGRAARGGGLRLQVPRGGRLPGPAPAVDDADLGPRPAAGHDLRP
jgi:hypothetical protein